MISPRVPDLAALDVLLTVAECGSFNAAAVTLGVSQQAVSQRIRAIESQVGVPLVHRGARGSVLTEAGALLANWAGKVVEAAAELDAGISTLRQERRAEFRVAASTTIAEHLMPGWLVALRVFRERHGQPIIDVTLRSLNSESVGARVRSGEAHVGFVEGHRPPDGVRSRVVAVDRLVIVVPPEHPWARRRRPLTGAELAGTALVAREAGSGTRNAFAAALPPGIVAARPAMELSTTSAVRGAVLAGAGPAVISDLAVGDDIATGRLVEVAIDSVDLTRRLRAVWLGGATPPTGATRDLIDIAVRASARP